VVVTLFAWPVHIRLAVAELEPSPLEDIPTLIELLDLWIGGAATTLVGAFAGRLMFHATEVKRG